jgi:hypothetical protein
VASGKLHRVDDAIKLRRRRDQSSTQLRAAVYEQWMDGTGRAMRGRTAAWPLLGCAVDANMPAAHGCAVDVNVPAAPGCAVDEFTESQGIQ